MKKRTLNQPLTNKVRAISILLFGLLCQSCFSRPESNYLDQAEKAKDLGNYSEAISTWEKVIVGFPNSEEALVAARKSLEVLSEKEANPVKKSEMLKYLVKLSKDPKELEQSQKELANLLFDILADYERAIPETYRLFNFQLTEEEKYQYRLNLARSFFYLKNFDQAEVEINEAIKVAISEEEKFTAKLTKANILIARKKSDLALEILFDLLKQNPIRSKQENIVITIALTFEEKGEIKKAISFLESNANNVSSVASLKSKTERLKARVEQLPGAQGLRK